jgi:hypothetical protein
MYGIMESSPYTQKGKGAEREKKKETLNKPLEKTAPTANKHILIKWAIDPLQYIGSDLVSPHPSSYSTSTWHACVTGSRVSFLFIRSNVTYFGLFTPYCTVDLQIYDRSPSKPHI